MRNNLLLTSFWPSLVLANALLLGVTSSSADQTRLTAPQHDAKVAFEKGIQVAMKEVELHCGAALMVTTDFEHHGKIEDLVKDDTPADICSNVLVGIANSCAAEARLVSSGKKPMGAAKVTAVACLFAGSHPKQPKDLTEDDTQRNMSFANGVFTIHMRDDLGNIDRNTFSILRGRTVDKTEPLKVGARCVKGGDCRTGLCARSICSSCTSNAMCGSGHFCSSGTCYADEAWLSTSPSNPSNPSSSKSTKRGKGLGAMCKSTSECESGRTCKAKTSKLSTCQ